ncbi:DNA helicase UvrD [Photobacterium aquimaris]|uniref:DNA 3'-5' helicase n=1 Tax=Photobacterium aquimaris TaxID=512643 RepID=A0A2T3IHK8_9GAMM|nr:ATP-dependent helicase [Photobacterium aquimaris]OBU15980.1 DNA helicase UvrD [Photobacterium aquimaris]OBU20468.1 DNA helicase UvrD [Photobacterium aquimaris]PSU27111.1 ATP-dependent helicase [Photobacterium aquimaris]PSV98512.1 ATP-dependent helicase [Photobacterium aquimaris]
MTRFTAEQTAFIYHQSGNALCVAGAGTGKTTTLVGVVEHKLQTIAAENMLVLMFNRDIRTDFKAKLAQIPLAERVPVHTFHSFCFQLLKQSGYLAATGYQIDFNNGDSDKTIAKLILRQMAAQEKSYQKQQQFKDPRTIELLMSFIGLVKAHMLPPKEVFELSEISSEYKFIIEAFWNFETVRKERKQLFFDDWLVETIQLLNNDPALQKHYHQQIQFMMVDEFQDINTAQYQLLKLLLSPQAQLVAVGDVDQCIYKWRGSAPQFMLNFEQDFAPATTYSLSHTFRFGHSLALAASHLIANNKQRFHDFQTIAHESVADTTVDVIGTARQVGEIAQSVADFIAQGGQPAEVAILVRRWSQAMLFELAFLTKKIPYHMPIGSVLTHSREVKLLMDIMVLATGRFLTLANNEQANLLFNLLSFPHCYVPNKSLRPLCEALAQRPSSEWLAVIKQTQKIQPTLNLETFTDRIELLLMLQRKGNFKALDVYRQYRRDSELDTWIWKTEATATEIEEAVERLDSVETVLESMDQNCEKALQYFEYYTQQSAAENQTQNNNSVQLTTIFRAKGCEYTQVHLPYWDKDAFPYVNRSALGISADTEEERRLAYVAITRAKQSAKIYYTVENTKKDQYVRKDKNASQFIIESKADVAQEIGPVLYQEGELPYHKSAVVQGYYRRLARFDDMQLPPKAVSISLPEPNATGESVYSYEWALQQPMPENADKLVRSLVQKPMKYLEVEVSRIVRELNQAGTAKKKVLLNRLIVVARAKARKYN